MDGAAVSLGALGIVTALTLAVEPAYALRQDVYESMPLEAFRGFDEIVSVAESVSCFTTWRGDVIDQIWRKSRIDPDSVDQSRGRVARGAPRDDGCHPIPGLPPDACTPQLGREGPGTSACRTSAPIEHRAPGRAPAEYFVDRRDAIAAFEALWALRDELAPRPGVRDPDHRGGRPVAQPRISEGFRGLPLHLAADQVAVDLMLRPVEASLAPFEPRPHWGKLFTLAPARFERATSGWTTSWRWPPGSTPTGSSGTASSTAGSSSETDRARSTET